MNIFYFVLYKSKLTYSTVSKDLVQILKLLITFPYHWFSIITFSFQKSFSKKIDIDQGLFIIFGGVQPFFTILFGEGVINGESTIY